MTSEIEVLCVQERKKPEVCLTAVFRIDIGGSTLLTNEERRGNEFKLQPKEFKSDGKILFAVRVL